RVLILAGLPALVVLIALFIIVAPADRITEGRCGKIERGMTQAQVEAILDGPGEEVDRSERDKVIHWKWEGRDGSIHVLFRNGRAVSEGHFFLRMDSSVCGVIRYLFWSIFEGSPSPPASGGGRGEDAVPAPEEAEQRGGDAAGESPR